MGTPERWTRAVLAQMLAQYELPPAEGGRSLSKIAQRESISRARVSRLLKKARQQRAEANPENS